MKNATKGILLIGGISVLVMLLKKKANPTINGFKGIENDFIYYLELEQKRAKLVRDFNMYDWGYLESTDKQKKLLEKNIDTIDKMLRKQVAIAAKAYHIDEVDFINQLEEFEVKRKI